MRVVVRQGFYCSTEMVVCWPLPYITHFSLGDVGVAAGGRVRPESDWRKSPFHGRSALVGASL